MIKGAGEYAGQPMLIVGLSGENVTRLIAGEPISFHTRDVSPTLLPPMQILIVGGRTEDDIVAELSGASGGPVTVKQDRRRDHGRRPE